jgi:hypothetical protein
LTRNARQSMIGIGSHHYTLLGISNSKDSRHYPIFTILVTIPCIQGVIIQIM